MQLFMRNRELVAPQQLMSRPAPFHQRQLLLVPLLLSAVILNIVIIYIYVSIIIRD